MCSEESSSAEGVWSVCRHSSDCWCWGNWKSTSTFWFQPIWGPCACGQHTVSFFLLVGVPVSAKQLKGRGSEYYLYSPWRTKGLWLCFIAKVLLFCLALLFFLHVLTSLMKFILWLRFFHRQEAGRGHGRGRTMGSCSVPVSPPLCSLLSLFALLAAKWCFWNLSISLFTQNNVDCEPQLTLNRTQMVYTRTENNRPNVFCFVFSSPVVSAQVHLSRHSFPIRGNLKMLRTTPSGGRCRRSAWWHQLEALSWMISWNQLPTAQAPIYCHQS